MGFYVGFSSGFRWGIVVMLAFTLAAPARSQIRFEPPLAGPWSFSGTFGELRSNHFHAGLDFKTGGREGSPILAAAHGCLSRIRQGPSGYGLALYLDHDSLFTTVYAHLHHAEPGVAALLDSMQWANNSFEIDTSVETGRFCFKKGDVLGISGNSGASEGPHLHFEIRDKITQEPLNPIPFLAALGDSVPPAFRKIALYRRISNQFVMETMFDCSESGMDTVELRTSAAECAIAVAATDPDRLGVYRIDWSVNDTVSGGFRFDRFNFKETRYANAHSDMYQEPGGAALRFHRLYRLPGDSCSIFRNSGECVLNFTNDSTCSFVRLICSDAFGNRDTVVLRVLFSPPVETHESSAKIEKYDTVCFGESEKLGLHGGAEVELSNLALYQDAVFSRNLRPERRGALHFHPVLPEIKVPFHEPQLLYLPVPLRNRNSGRRLVAIRTESPNGKPREVLTSSSVHKHRVAFRIRSGGWYALAVDSIPPRMEGIRQQQDEVDGLVYTDCRISDEMSGVARYNVFRNHRWILAEYDAKTGRLRWKPDPSGTGPQLISIVLEDKCGNMIRYDLVESIP